MSTEREKEPRSRMSGKAALAWLAAGVIGLPLGFLSLERANRYGSSGGQEATNFLCDPLAGKPIELGKTQNVSLPPALAEAARAVVRNAGAVPPGDGSMHKNVAIVDFYTEDGSQERKQSGVVFDYESHDFTAANGHQLRINVLDAGNGAIQVLPCFDNK